VLPVDEVLPELLSVLTSRCRAVLIAPPGAGKTTRVPPALLEMPGRIVMLEPRRLAARAAARRMASERGEAVGGTVGFRVRGESRVSAATRIEVVTEGVLTRMLQHDPSLDGIGTVIFDEFHERSLVADTALALVLGASCVLRDDLAVLVMSATLDAAAVAALMGGAPVIRSEGLSWPVETRYAPNTAGRWIEDHVASVVRDTLDTESGSVLVFLPGAGEIKRVESALTGTVPRDVVVLPLYGAMSAAQQDAAIAPARPGQRKVVLATNVAETSLTIDGIRVVIDAGLERIPRFSPRSGMTRLETVRITRSSADQRRGRAGRTAPGVAIRCWSAAEDAGLVPAPRAEILEADLAPLALELAALAFHDPNELPWLDPPPAAALAVGRQLLQALGALDSAHRITAHGRAMLEHGTHPRLAHMMLLAKAHGEPSLRRATIVAALLDERDILRGEGGPPPADLQLRVEVMERDADQAMLAGATLDRGAMAAVRERIAGFHNGSGLSAHGVRASHEDPASVAQIAGWGWPDRVAMRREAAGKFLMANGRGVRIDVRDPLAQAPWLVVAAVDDSGRDARVQLAAALDDDDVQQLLAERRESVEEVTWDDDAAAVVARRRERLGAIVLADHPLRDVDPERIAIALLEGVAAHGIGALPWSDTSRRLRERLAFLHAHDPTWPDVGDAALLMRLGEWLAPFIGGMRRLEQLAALDLHAALLTLVPWELRRRLDELAPERIEVPSGSHIALDYSEPMSPVLAVRLQEVFGMAVSPTLLDGRVAVTMQLLSPAHRPVQTTRDLASFWRSGYFDVRKDLRGRYPKHHWPEDPVTAEATRGAKQRKS
jgi:ATP-dependent helicase HrpB